MVEGEEWNLDTTDFLHPVIIPGGLVESKLKIK